jgi:predicted Zn finger-like uncharacterized protein
MKFVCDRCQTRYSIADEKVRQKILRIRCKTCGNVIMVQEGLAAPPTAGPVLTEQHPSVVAKSAPSSGPQTVPSSSPKGISSSGPKGMPSSSPKMPSSGPKGIPSSGPKGMPLSRPNSMPTAAKAASAGPPPPPPAAASVPADPLGGRVEWYLAVGGVQNGPFSRTEAAKHILATDSGKIVHVWKEGMPSWKPSTEVSVIATEVNLLRPTPPPPPPAEPPKTMPPPQSGAYVTPAAKAANQSLFPEPATEKQLTPAPLLPKPRTLAPVVSKPRTPAPVSVPVIKQRAPVNVPEAFDIPIDTDEFAELTTKKATKLQEVMRESGRDGFSEVTTKKGKNLRELEAEPLFSSAPAFSESERTPPPAHPLPPLSAKPTEPGTLGVGSPRLPTVPKVTTPMAAGTSSASYQVTTIPNVTAPMAASASSPSMQAAPKVTAPGVGGTRSANYQGTPIPLVTVPVEGGSRSPVFLELEKPNLAMAIASPTVSPLGMNVEAAPTGSQGVNGFSEVIAAVAAADKAGGADPLVLNMEPNLGTDGQPLSPEFKSGFDIAALFRNNPALKYVLAAVVIVTLVILLVMVSLRMEIRKNAESEPEPANPPTKEEPTKPTTPTRTEEPKPQPKVIQVEPSPEDERPTRSGRSGKRGSRRISRSSSSVHVRQQSPKQQNQPVPTLAARPNPFDEGKTVSQSQISSVVRNKTNQAALKSCYERALKMDNRLTSGRMDITVSISTAGTVQRVVVNAPSSFLLVEPCIKGAVRRWVFPPNVEEYATNFPLIMQGGM